MEMTGGTKDGAQIASSLRPRCVGEVDPKPGIISLSIYLSIYVVHIVTIGLLNG
jgi:hypothetical protein